MSACSHKSISAKLRATVKPPVAGIAYTWVAKVLVKLPLLMGSDKAEILYIILKYFIKK